MGFFWAQMVGFHVMFCRTFSYTEVPRDWECGDVTVTGDLHGYIVQNQVICLD